MTNMATPSPIIGTLDDEPVTARVVGVVVERYLMVVVGSTCTLAVVVVDPGAVVVVSATVVVVASVVVVFGTVVVDFGAVVVVFGTVDVVVSGTVEVVEGTVVVSSQIVVVVTWAVVVVLPLEVSTVTGTSPELPSSAEVSGVKPKEPRTTRTAPKAINVVGTTRCRVGRALMSGPFTNRRHSP